MGPVFIGIIRGLAFAALLALVYLVIRRFS